MNARTLVSAIVVADLALLALGCAESARHAPATPVVAAPAFDPGWLVGGTWVAHVSETPFGEMPFVFDFRRQPDGTIHAHTGDDEQYVDLRFRRGTDGTWSLDERAAFPGLGVQGYTLRPMPAATKDTQEWHVEGKPDFLTIRVTRTGDDAMTFAVLLRGQPHVRFELAREHVAMER